MTAAAALSPSIGARVDAKKSFFDRLAVINAMDKASHKALGHIGGYVRKVARNSIRSKDGTSTPGNPPFSHYGYLKDGIFYAFDKETNGVVIGPVLLNGIRGNRFDALEVLEYGGYTIRFGKPARYRARPFMGPALDSAQPLDRFWENSVK